MFVIVLLAAIACFIFGLSELADDDNGAFVLGSMIVAFLAFLGGIANLIAN